MFKKVNFAGRKKQAQRDQEWRSGAYVPSDQSGRKLGASEKNKDGGQSAIEKLIVFHLYYWKESR